MGNSEVGHNAIGAGRVFDQGAKLVNEAIATGALFDGAGLEGADRQRASEHGRALHFIGLFSDGNVHSHIDHLEGDARREAKAEGVKQRARPPPARRPRRAARHRALDYVDRFEAFLADLNADGARRLPHRLRRRPHEDHHGPLRGRLGHGRARLGHPRARRGRAASPPRARPSRPTAPRTRASSTRTCRRSSSRATASRSARSATATRVIFFNFRGDRAIEITPRLRGRELRQVRPRRRGRTSTYAGMMQYDGDRTIPKQFLVAPPGDRPHDGRVPGAQRRHASSRSARRRSSAT